MTVQTHILIGGPCESPSELQHSTLASARLRLAVAAAAAQELDQKISLGEQCPQQVDRLVVGKIGANDIQNRQRLWLSEIERHKGTGARILLDYTDHHLINNSVMTPFYRTACEMVDVICVPTHSLGAALTEQCGIQCKIEVIPDLLEYEVVKPKAASIGKNPVGMWFGHPTNAEFLAKFIDAHHRELSGHKLNIVSTPQTLEVLKRYPFSTPPKISVAAFQWSVQAVARVAEVTDYCIIPSHTDSAKRYASNNRLITALTLGLPTIATALPSYVEFSNYFLQLGSSEGKDFLSKLSRLKHNVESFQKLHVARFQSPELVRQWSLLLE
jgi:hypothetical protein